MTMQITSPVTGSAQTGFTSPTYTLALDTSPSQNGRQLAVTQIGGTQAGVVIHSVSSPFTISCFRPLVLKALKALGVDGILRTNERNVYKVITRKGVIPLAGQAAQTMIVTTEISVPVGADTADPANIRAALSAHLGSCSQVSAGIGDTAVSGIL